MPEMRIDRLWPCELNLTCTTCLSPLQKIGQVMRPVLALDRHAPAAQGIEFVYECRNSRCDQHERFQTAEVFPRIEHLGAQKMLELGAFREPPEVMNYLGALMWKEFSELFPVES